MNTSKMSILATQLFEKLKFDEQPRLVTIVFEDGQAHIFSENNEGYGSELDSETITIAEEIEKLKAEKKKLQGDILNLENKKKQVEKAIKILKEV